MPGYSSDVMLVNEIWDRICSYLTHQSLANLRLACRHFNDIALPHQYRSLRLEAFGDSVQRFVDIAKSPRLHKLVRKITIDTHVDFDFEYTGNQTYPFPQSFMEALPHLRYFTNITSLHIRFEEHCGEDEVHGSSLEEVAELRYRVLDTIMHCAAGMWTLEKQRIIDKVLLEYMYAEDEMEEFDYSNQDLGFINDGPLPLRELTVTNLADNDDANLTLSEAWNAVISLPSLVDLRLLVATEENQSSPENGIYLENKYYFFQSLHETWLSPNLSQNLRVLSLYFRDYWGWFPKMDFRLIGEDSPFPHLKVLALGNYVFSHRWQIEWFAKIGKENSSGGLEELYLDDCPILYKARQKGPLHDGYPDFVSILEDRDDADPSMYTFPLRWHDVFSQWKNSMKGLRVLKMGSGSWFTTPMCTYNTMLCDPEYAKLSNDVLHHRTSHNIHRDFACPAPIPRGTYWKPECREIFALGKYLNGEGISDTRDRRMQYVEYDIGVGPSAWCEKRNISTAVYDGYEPEEGTLMKDNQVWDEMLAANEAKCATH
ncbi:uncharacterized protein FTOL_07496 [Fusarium torulosum]|uniref:F-box domain-containing protein n=1 Tax=Fusarium torulosum TaxID=33205 RepID=A0AAE8SJH1_9HYPO|nr:uncharacterized protein FTOL_07496 [Fusarium torulosum]